MRNSNDRMYKYIKFYKAVKNNELNQLKKYQIGKHSQAFAPGFKRILCEFEMADLMSDNTLSIQLETFAGTLQQLVETCKGYYGSTSKHRGYKDDEKTQALKGDAKSITNYKCRYQMSPILNDILKMRSRFSSILCFYPILCKYLHWDEKAIRFHSPKLSKSGKKWLTSITIDINSIQFDASGLPSCDGSLHFQNKFGFWPLISSQAFGTLGMQWLHLWKIIHMMRMSVLDETKWNKHKMIQWLYFMLVWIQIIQNVLENFEANMETNIYDSN